MSRKGDSEKGGHSFALSGGIAPLDHVDGWHLTDRTHAKGNRLRQGFENTCGGFERCMMDEGGCL